MSVVAQGAEVFVSDQGRGKPILFLHGNPDSADLWNETIDRLKGEYRCVAIDLPGFGRTKTPRDFDYSFENLGRFVDTVVEQVGLNGPVHLAAHDFGGAFAMAWATLHPEKVDRIVVINHAFFIGDYDWHFWARIWRTPLLGELAMLSLTWPGFHWIMRKAAKNLSREQVRHAYSIMSASRWMVLRLYRAADPAEFRKWEPRMVAATARKPKLVLWGEDDPHIPAGVADRFGAQRVERFPGSGHWLPIECPHRVAEEMSAFLGRDGGA